MAGEVQVPIPSKPTTAYFVVRNAVGQYWYPTGSVFEAYNAAHWTSYAIAMTQDGSSQGYTGTFPSGIATGVYRLYFYSQVGGSAANTDTLAGTWPDFQWSGSAVVSLDSRTKPADTIATVTNLTNAPSAGDFTATMKTSLNAAAPAVSISAGGITAASFAAGAIDNAAIAPNAIGASELATDAVTEIQAGLATSTALSAAQTDIDDIQSRLPAALVSGRMDSNMQAAANNVITAAVVATDAVAEIQNGLAVPGDAMTLTSYYDAAKTAAQAGDQMALTGPAIEEIWDNNKLRGQWRNDQFVPWTLGDDADDNLGGYQVAPASDTESLPSMIEDVGGKRFTTKALEQGPSGSGGGGTTGAFLDTITVDDGTDPVEGAIVRYLWNGSTWFTGMTDADGLVEVPVDAHTYTVAITCPTFNGLTATRVVTADGSHTYSMDAVVITPSTDPQTTCYLTVLDNVGQPKRSIPVQLRITGFATGSTGTGISVQTSKGVTDINGLVQFTGQPQGATYELTVNSGPVVKGVTDNTTTTALVNTLGVISV